MKESTGKGRRTLLLFVAPLVFALVAMGPTTPGRLLGAAAAPGAAFSVAQGGALELRTIEADAVAALLEGRICVRAGEIAAPAAGDFVLEYDGWQLLLKPEKQYLVSRANERNTYRLFGEPLRSQVEELVESPND